METRHATARTRTPDAAGGLLATVRRGSQAIRQRRHTNERIRERRRNRDLARMDLQKLHRKIERQRLGIAVSIAAGAAAVAGAAYSAYHTFTSLTLRNTQYQTVQSMRDGQATGEHFVGYLLAAIAFTVAVVVIVDNIARGAEKLRKARAAERAKGRGASEKQIVEMLSGMQRR